MTQKEFFAWAEVQDGKYEFDGVQPVATMGGDIRHALISRNLNAALLNRLRSGRCRSLPSEAGGGVATVGDTVRYPDATVTCSPMPGSSRQMPDPVVVFEVLSLTSRHTDLVVKRIECATIPSILCYMVIEQAGVEAHAFSRRCEGKWTEEWPLGPGSTLLLPGIGIELPLADLYEDVSFES